MGGIAAFIKGSQFFMFGGDDQNVCECILINQHEKSPQISSAPVEESKGAQLGFSLAGKKAVGGGLASKQTKMLDNYLTYDLGKLNNMCSCNSFREENVGKSESWKG